jgi:hypothetical protein
VRIGVSVSTFVPKAHTPFQWKGQVSLDEILRRQEMLRSAMPRKGIDLSWHDAQVSLLEGMIARGGREVADVIEQAWMAGARFDAWSERFDLDLWKSAFESTGVDGATIAERSYDREEPLPWAHISSGVSERYLWLEHERALAGRTTEDCSLGRCTGCDVCGDLDIEIVLGGEARGRG